MIIIKLIHDGTSYLPERQLSKQEKLTVLLTISDGNNIYHYQEGDELPKISE